MKRSLPSFTQDEMEFIELVSTATHIAAWRLLGVVIERSYGVLSAEETKLLDCWLESHAAERRSREVFDRIMAEGMHISQVKKKGTGDSTSPAHLPRREPDAGGPC